MDAYTPFPVHGIDDAIGIKRTILPWICLGTGLAAAAIGLGLQYYCNATDTIWPFEGYKYMISGKPFFSFARKHPGNV